MGSERSDIFTDRKSRQAKFSCSAGRPFCLLSNFCTFFFLFLKAGFLQSTSFPILQNTQHQERNLPQFHTQWFGGSRKTNLSLDNVAGSRILHLRSLSITGMSIQGEDQILLNCGYLNLRQLTRNSCAFGSNSRESQYTAAQRLTRSRLTSDWS